MKNLKLNFGQQKKFDPFVLDVETQYLAAEIDGGWNSIDKFLVSVAVSFDQKNGLRVWHEEDAANLIREAQKYPQVVTFNGEGFDFIVLSHYGDTSSLYQSSVDLLKISKKILGFRVHLDSIAKSTLKAEKTADGLQAVEWWRSGDPALRQKVVEYCKQDVVITSDIYHFALQKGYLLCTDLHDGTIKYNVPKASLGV